MTRGLEMLSTDLATLQSVARDLGAAAAFLGGSIVQGTSTPRSDVDLYLLGERPGPGCADTSASDRTGRLPQRPRIDLEWIGLSDFCFVGPEPAQDSRGDHERLRLLADLEMGFPVLRADTVAELLASVDRPRLGRWAIDYLILLARSYLDDVRGLVETDFSRHAVLPLSTAALSALSAILWARGVPVHNPRWATAIAARNGMDDDLVTEASELSLLEIQKRPYRVDTLADRIEAMIETVEAREDLARASKNETVHRT